MFHDHVITILHGPCNHNAPEFLSSPRGGEITGEALVNITVKDLNDNAPRFLHAVEHVSAVENWSTGHLIFQAKASDPDEGTNGVMVYSLKQNPKGLFHIQERHGLITLTGPLEASTSSYQVEVLASDMGVPQRTSSLILLTSLPTPIQSSLTKLLKNTGLDRKSVV